MGLPCFCCSSCNRDFSAIEFVCHLELVHRLTQAEIKERFEKPKAVVCQKCFRSYHSKKAYLDHVKNGNCPFPAEKTRASQPIFQCDKCSKIFATKYNLKDHIENRDSDAVCPWRQPMPEMPTSPTTPQCGNPTATLPSLPSTTDNPQVAAASTTASGFPPSTPGGWSLPGLTLPPPEPGFPPSMPRGQPLPRLTLPPPELAFSPSMSRRWPLPGSALPPSESELPPSLLGGWPLPGSTLPSSNPGFPPSTPGGWPLPTISPLKLGFLPSTPGGRALPRSTLLSPKPGFPPSAPGGWPLAGSTLPPPKPGFPPATPGGWPLPGSTLPPLEPGIAPPLGSSICDASTSGFRLSTHARQNELRSASSGICTSESSASWQSTKSPHLGSAPSVEPSIRASATISAKPRSFAAPQPDPGARSLASAVHLGAISPHEGASASDSAAVSTSSSASSSHRGNVGASTFAFGSPFPRPPPSFAQTHPASGIWLPSSVFSSGFRSAAATPGR